MKILIRLGIVLVVLIAGLLIAGQIIVNKPFFREKITKIASDALHRDVSLSGLSLSIFPSIGVNLKDFNINEQDGKTSFASLANLRVSVALFPLLKKEIIIKEIYLDHPKINVEKKNENTFNFSDIINATASVSTQSVTREKTQAPETKEASASPNITIDSIRINQAELMYKETLPSGEVKSFHLKGLDLGVDDFSFTQPVIISLSCGFGESAELSVKGKLGPLSAKPEQMQAAVEIDLHGLSDKDLAPFVPKETLNGMGFEKLLVKGNVNGSLESGISGNLEVSLNLLPANKEIHVNSSFQAKNLEEVTLKELIIQLGKTAKISVHGKAGPLNVPSDQIKTDMELDLSGLSSDDLLAFVPAEKFQGNSFQNLSVKGKVQGSMAEQITGDLTVSVKVLPADKDINVKGSFQAVGMETLNLKELSVQVGKTAHVLMKGNISGLKGPQENIKADIDLDLSGLNSAELAPFVTAEQLQGYGFQNLTVKGKVQGSMADQLGGDLSVSLKLLPDNKDIRLKGSVIGKKNDEFTLKELALNFGSSDLTLTGNIKNLKAPKGQFDLKSNLINGEDFLLSSPKTDAKAAKEEPKKEESKSAGPENPLYGNSIFQNTDMVFNTDLKKIQFKGNVIENLNFKITVKQGMVTMNPFALSIFGGKISGTGVVNLQSEKIGFDIQQQMTDIMLEQASKANTGEEKIFGKLTGNASFKGTGLSKPDLQKTLSGQAKVEIKEGKTVGANLKKQVLLKMDNPLLTQLLPGLVKMQQDAKKEPDIKETKFKDFIIDTNIASGKANLQKMNLTTDDFTLRGSGPVDFDMQANLQTQLVFSKAFTEGLTGGKDLSGKLPYENGGMLIPVRITGSLNNPTVLPDFAAIIGALAKGELGQKLGNLLGGKEGKDGKKSNPLSNLLGGNQNQGTQSSDSGTANTTSSSQSSPLGNLLGGNQSNVGTTNTQSAPAKQNPLGNLLGGGQNSSGQTSQQENPLDALLGGGNNQNSSQSQGSNSEQQQQNSDNPLKKLKLF